MALTLARMLCLLSVLLAPNARGQLAHAPGTDTGKVRGRVLDFGPRNRTFVIEGKGLRQTVEVDADGNYEVELPKGFYRIKTRVNPDGDEINPGDLVSRRASFSVNPGATVEVNLSSLRDRVYCTSHGKVLLVVLDDGAEEVNYRRPRYDTLWLPDSIKKPRDVVIEYCGKNELRDSTVYKNATLTHDEVTITASYLQLNKKTYMLRARGTQVIIEDGAGMTTGSQAEVDLKTNRVLRLGRNKRSRK